MSYSIKLGMQPLRHKKSHTVGMSMIKKQMLMRTIEKSLGTNSIFDFY